MSSHPQEIELKLSLPVRAAPQLRRHPLLAGLDSRRQWVENLYYDTPDQALRQQKLALRRRRVGQQWLLTVKAPVQELDNGLSTRLEWEYPITGDPAFDFSGIDHAPLRTSLEALAPSLGLAFRTDFYRQCWQVPSGNSQIELALDLGHIRAAGRREAIHEVELELLDGSTPDVLAVARQLMDELPLVPFKPSKAARGYALANR